MRIAVIGSGIAGLSAAWYLGRRHRVTLFERAPRPGFDAHTVNVEAGSGSVAVNVPMRVFFEAYYPTLVALYRELELAHEPVPYAASFSDLGGETYFRYTNLWLGPVALPMVAGRSARRPRALRLGLEILRFFRRAARDLEREDLGGIDIDAYLARRRSSRELRERFLFPALAGICTCSYSALRRYPASVLLGYLTSGLFLSKVSRLVHGTEEAARKLVGRVHEVRCAATVEALERDERGVAVVEQGRRESFDHVVIATQANHASRIVPDQDERARRALESFSYERGEVVVHGDERLAPRDRREWAPVNFLVSPEHDRPMASISLGQVYPGLEGRPPVFETWNPIRDLDPARVLGRATFERPVVTESSLAGLGQLDALHREEHRRVWMCGSYAKPGIPLLESAVASAKDVAERVDHAAR